MMMLRRGDNLVLGLTDKNVQDLKAGDVLRVRPEDTGEASLMIYIVCGVTHDEMRTALRKAGFDVDNGDGQVHPKTDGGPHSHE